MVCRRGSDSAGLETLAHGQPATAREAAAPHRAQGAESAERTPRMAFRRAGGAAPGLFGTSGCVVRNGDPTQGRAGGPHPEGRAGIPAGDPALPRRLLSVSTPLLVLQIGAGRRLPGAGARQAARAASAPLRAGRSESRERGSRRAPPWRASVARQVAGRHQASQISDAWRPLRVPSRRAEKKCSASEKVQRPPPEMCRTPRAARRWRASR